MLEAYLGKKQKGILRGPMCFTDTPGGPPYTLQPRGGRGDLINPHRRLNRGIYHSLRNWFTKGVPTIFIKRPCCQRHSKHPQDELKNIPGRSRKKGMTTMCPVPVICLARVLIVNRKLMTERRSVSTLHDGRCHIIPTGALPTSTRICKKKWDEH